MQKDHAPWAWSFCMGHNGPVKRIAVAALAFACSLAIAQDQPQRRVTKTGTIVFHEAVESKVLNNKRRVWIYLPPGYAESKERYPVLYMHDGQNVFSGDTSYLPNLEWRADEAAEALIKAKLIPPIVIVAIANAEVERANEFLPTRARMGSQEAGGKADLYGKFITDELMPFVNKTYRTKTGPANTGLAGSSFGGIVTLHVGLTRPDVFGKLGVLSPSVWWDDRVMIKRVEALPKKLGSRIWMDMGTLEGPGAVTDARRLRDALTAKGWKEGVDLVYYEDGFAVHNEGAWASRIGMILLYLFGR